MEKRLQEELKKASAANQAAATAAAEAAEEKLRRMHQEFSRQMQARVQQNEQNVKSIKDQAEAEIHRADREREQVAAATIEQEMKKVRQRESEVDRQRQELAIQQKAMEDARNAEEAANLIKQQRAERQIMDLKKELKKQKQKQSSPGHPLHVAQTTGE